jgi:hypothetical protein
MAENVLFDPQFSLQRVLKPFDGFEDTYQGKSGTAPIAMYAPDENGQRPPRDPDAGKPGFSPNLLRYFDVPMGALVAMWLPMAFYAEGDQVFTATYGYRVKWRMRNVTDYRNRRTPYHINQQFPGAPDSSDVANPQRLIIPAAYDNVELQQPTPLAGPVEIKLRPREYVTPPSTEILDDLPLLPGGLLGVHEQGIFDPSTFGPGADVVRNAMFFPPKFFLARGDQMIVEALKITNRVAEPWDFGATGADLTFGKLYGSDSPEGSGIYIFTGAGPNQD